VSGILFVRGDERHARGVARDEGHGYWSAALPLVLEKHGHLGIRCAGPEALEDAALLRSASTVLVASLPHGAWSGAAVRSIFGASAAVLIEGPLEPALASKLEIESDRAELEGTVTVGDADLKQRAARYGADAGGTLARPTTRPVAREPQWRWQGLSQVPVTAELAQIWQQPGWRASQWRTTGTGSVLAHWTPLGGGAPHVAIIRFGGIYVLSFGLFAYLAQSHTAEPIAGDEHRTSPRTLGLEVLLLALLEQMHARAERPLARVLPWPDGYRWALNVRHDFDRRLPLRRVREVLRGHESIGSAATWYWRGRHLDRGGRWFASGRKDRRVVREVAARERQEVALHTEGLWVCGEAEQARVEEAAGQRVRGTAAHGDPNGFRWQGAPNVLWAHRRGLSYTELIQHAHVHPHRFATLAGDGAVRPLDIVCLPHHESLDRSSTGGDTAHEHVLSAAVAYMRAGGLLQVLNHPDINVEELFRLLARLPEEGRWDVTAGDAVDWWAKTHVPAVLRLEWTTRTQLQMTSELRVRDLAVNVLTPDGESAVHVVDLAPGDSVTLA
jgi:hypothetical protein